MIRLHLDRSAEETLVQQAREQIVSALHLGKARAGDRLPSVRSLSRASGIDPKTAHRIYHALAEEGYVQLRPGSGAYVKEIASSLLDQVRALAILKLVRKHVTAAAGYEIDPQRYADLVARYAERRKSGSARKEKIAFIECNREQLDMISLELTRRADVVTAPVLLAPLLDEEKRSLAVAASCKYLVTTDYHFNEVEPLARRLGKRLFCVRLDPRILESMLALASRGTLGMVVSDVSFLPRFRRSIMRLGLDRDATKRIEAAAGSDRDRVRQMISRADALYVSPLCAAQVKDLIPPTMPVLQPRTHLSTESVESIKALLLFGDSASARKRS